jgi:hypothetical protein
MTWRSTTFFPEKEKTYGHLYHAFRATLERKRLRANHEALKLGPTADRALPALSATNSKPRRNFTKQGWCPDRGCHFAHDKPPPKQTQGGGWAQGPKGDKGPKGKGKGEGKAPKDSKGGKDGKGGNKGRKGDGRSRSPSRAPDGARRVCYAYAAGKCSRNAAECRFEHKIPIPPGDVEHFKNWCRKNNVSVPRSATPGVTQNTKTSNRGRVC